MKIVLVAPTDLPAYRANTIQVMKMAQALTVLGHDVVVFVPTQTRQKAVPWEEIATQYGLQHPFRVRWFTIAAWARRYDYGLRAVLAAQANRADLLYTRLPQAAAFASLLGFPTVYEIHDLPRGNSNPRLLRWFLKGRGARKLLIITAALKQALETQVQQLPLDPFTLILPDGVDLERYANLPAPEVARANLGIQLGKACPPESFVVGYTGSLYAGRGVELILKIAAILPKIQFLIIGGDAADVSRVAAEAESRGLQNLTLLKFVANADLPLFQAACDLLLMPYQNQVAASSGGDIAAFLSPMKLFEYMAARRAILSSDLPVLGEILNPENAVLLPPNEAAAWAGAIQALQANPERRQKLAAQAFRDVQRYTWTARAARILA